MCHEERTAEFQAPAGILEATSRPLVLTTHAWAVSRERKGAVFHHKGDRAEQPNRRCIQHHHGYHRYRHNPHKRRDLSRDAHGCVPCPAAEARIPAQGSPPRLLAAEPDLLSTEPTG
jgi:hypothetical protein